MSKKSKRNAGRLNSGKEWERARKAAQGDRGGPILRPRPPRDEDEAIGVVSNKQGDEGWIRREYEFSGKNWEVVGKEHPDPRQVAVQFYLALLASCARGGGIHLMAARNRVGEEYPKCISHRGIVHDAVHKFEDTLKTNPLPEGPLKEKDKEDVSSLLNYYIGSKFYKYLKDARIFQFKARDFNALYHIADLYVTTGAGYKWVPADIKKLGKTPHEEAVAVANFTLNEGVKVPYPEKLPFDSCYFAWGTGVQPSYVQAHQYGLDPRNFNLIMGTLVSSTGWAFTIIMKGKADTVGFAVGKDQSIIGGMRQLVVVERIGEYNYEEHKYHKHADEDALTSRDRIILDSAMPEERLMPEGWTLPYALAPWMIVYAVDAIDSNDSLIKVQPGTLHERMMFQRFSKQHKKRFMPAPYYTVIVQPTTYEEYEKTVRSRPRKPVDYRFDVRGHYGHKVVRGTLPIDPKLIWQLHKRKYEIFHALNRPHGEALALLMRRRIQPPRENEWLAYLRFRRDNFIKGPKDKPYIPSVRRLKKGLPNV